MRLTRRDALAVPAGLGVTGGTVSLTRFDPSTTESTDGRDDSSGEDGADGDDAPPTAVRETVVATGEVVFPGAAGDVSEFIKAYVVGHARDDARRDAIVNATTESDDVTRDWEGTAFAGLPAGDRNRLLRRLGVDTADPAQDGTLSEHLRFHVMNEPLYAFYALPAGGRLVGIENPVGHSGGAESYRRATMDTPGELPGLGGEHDG